MPLPRAALVAGLLTCASLASGTASTRLLPLGDPTAWEVLQFRHIRPNAVSFAPASLRIDVDGSAGPVVHALARPLRVQGLRATGRLEGTVQTTASKQGQAGHDDYALRVGLVEIGTRRPGWLERRFAPAWVQRLFDLAPADLGIAGIRFYNLGLDASQIGQTRTHPASDLLTERVVAAPEADGSFRIVVDLPAPIDVAGVWLSSDGDDTRSRYSVRLAELALVVVPAASDAATGPL